MHLAYFSPLGPQPSGIADYSEELVPHLVAAGAGVTLFVDGFRPSNDSLAASFPVRDYRRDPTALGTLDEFDAVLYHMGNDHRYHAGIFDAMRARPGVTVFHDFALQDFFLGLARERRDLRIYLDELEACHGERAAREAEETLARGGVPAALARPLDFPLNCRLARASEGIIVHSEWSRARFAAIAPGVPLRRVSHHITRKAAAGVDRAPRAEGGPVRIASFGLITPDKGIERALRVLSTLRDTHDFLYTLVGAPNDFFDVRALVRECGLEGRVEITGHVSLGEFERRISETDIALNLRERTAGETSGSLCRIMAAGVAAVVSDVGWFGELPADSVVKIDPGPHADALLRAYLERLIEDARLRATLGANARRHMLAEHDIRRSAEGYLALVEEVLSARPRRRFVSGVSEELSALGVRPERDAEFMHAVAAEVATLTPARIFVPDGDGNPNGDESTNGGGHARLVRPQPAKEVDASNGGGRLKKIEGVDYKRAAVEYPRKLDPERHHYLYTKPFYNLANKPPKHAGDGMDAETFRHFCDFANVAVALALPAGSRILDVGCGSGWLSEYFARLGYDVTGIDISPDLIEIAKERVASVAYDADHETPLRCRFLVHDAEGSPLAEEFDAVVCYDSLHHFEDERAVVRNLSAMTRYGGALFILEGDRPEEGSETEEELLEVMRHFETLESPFSREYLRTLLDEHGLAVVGDYVSVNGLFERDSLEGGRLRVEPPEVNYLLCKKVVREEGTRASSVPDSRNPSRPAARMSFEEAWPEEVEPGALLNASLRVENAGDTLWLTGGAERAGSCMLGARVSDETGAVVWERHGTPPLPRPLAPGERVVLNFEMNVPRAPGLYTLKLDLVAQHVCWFEERGSTPLVVKFRVRPDVS
ncbi:MAG TPA: methyltransferase domain-containing protein [Pyrinomonadaceae bacterium]|jgi:2-polyprenyl-3-methyl-5-hydroxy-6-metoxy-1,4-benzoquinol methylase/glycosyltransferase involved in cell wall biosynthesis|nr:methyltransferase domain-containing protein [Pyrinomonadaceae bacterium]